jgi:carbonic anhydrase/acetyltransferase-like protein (isoleucine patch superfamily)
LQSAAELRKLTMDAFNLRVAFRPEGREIKPGVWVGENATIHASARVVAPAFIGARTKVRAAALITRGSSIEHHCEIDCGTVVQASNVLPFSYVGAGLELLHSAAGARHVANSASRRTAEIFDARLLNELSDKPAVRLAESLGKVATFIPAQLMQGVLKSLKTKPEMTCTTDVAQAAMATTLPAPAEAALAAGLAATTMTRNHGNE